jgi:hypothetical protein
MIIDETQICEEIAEELKLPLQDVIKLTTEYKGKIIEAVKNYKKSNYEDKEFKILMPKFCTFKRKIFKNENSRNT